MSGRDDSVSDGARHHKLHGHHLERIAIVYIRQSSLRQVTHNQESTRLQYALKRRAERWGWPASRIEVIDDDLGVSGTSVAGRVGFQRLLREVALDHVGLVLGIEMSRLARSNRDWHQLLDLCGRFRTLIADADGLYDPNLHNDRLLLGLKGTMSEAELHVIRQRLDEGKLSKARRGELALRLPSGYLRRPSGEVILDPDEEVRATIEYIFDAFDRIGTLHGLLSHLVESGTRIGGRGQEGPDMGQLVWRRPHRGLLSSMLRNPIYAGAYVYGRKRADPRRKVPGAPASGRVSMPSDEWLVCLWDRMPAYITRERYEANQRRLADNRSAADRPGTPRKGAALLQGLVRCGRCGLRMLVDHTSGRRGQPRYHCVQARLHYGTPLCQSLSVGCLDELVRDLALAALTPAALELSLRAIDDVELQRAQADALWQKRLERCRYEVELAAKQYHAVDPENRLVARSLETSWEEALRAYSRTKEEHRRHLERQPGALTADERQCIARLAADAPALWHAETTTQVERKAILRLLVDEVIPTVEGETEWVQLTIRWAGGHETRHRIVRPVGNLSQLARYEELRLRIRSLREQGLGADAIAAILNSEGWRTPTRRGAFTGQLLRTFYGRHELRSPKGHLKAPGDDCWWLTDLALELDVPRPTLYGWMRRGLLDAHQVEKPRRSWVVRADAAEVERLRAYRDRGPRGDEAQQ